MKPEACPHWYKCNAAVCFLEPAIGAHLDEDAVCRVARELVKAGGREHVIGYASAELADAVGANMPIVRARWHNIDRRLGKSAESGIRKGQPRAVFDLRIKTTAPKPS
jgi:hypothetical protein